MSKRFKIALVGRPNVGKSALFNRITGKRISIVNELEGVTRDRLYADVEFFNQFFTLIDTGGMDPTLKVPFNEEVRRQAEIAVEEADSIILVVDGQEGATQLDIQVARMLLKKGKRVCVAVNKVDGHGHLDKLFDFYSLGIPEMIGVSALHDFQIVDLVETALEGYFKPLESDDDRTKVAIVGRANTGKSTLINAFLNDDRCVVSPIAGTTRDSIDIPFEFDGTEYTLIDTAGIRRLKTQKIAVDKFAAMRTERAIARADVCVLVVNAEDGFTTQEKRIANQIEEAGKPCVILFNKWDLIKNVRMEHALQSMRDSVPFLNHCPVIFISAKEGRNLEQILPKAEEVFKNASRRITTGELNKFLEQRVQRVAPPMLRGKRLRIYYMSQVAANPPQFVLFVNHPDLMVPSYKKYLFNGFREFYPYEGVPLRFKLKGRKEKRPDHHPKAVSAEPALIDNFSDLLEV